MSGDFQKKQITASTNPDIRYTSNCSITVLMNITNQDEDNFYRSLSKLFTRMKSSCLKSHLETSKIPELDIISPVEDIPLTMKLYLPGVSGAVKVNFSD
jgi:hypothetical protein